MRNTVGLKRGWKPGESGNPHGRPKQAVEFARWLREEKFADLAVRQALWRRAQRSDYLMNTLLQYAFGKPSQQVSISGSVVTRTIDVFPDGRQVVRESRRLGMPPTH